MSVELECPAHCDLGVGGAKYKTPALEFDFALQMLDIHLADGHGIHGGGGGGAAAEGEGVVLVRPLPLVVGKYPGRPGKARMSNFSSPRDIITGKVSPDTYRSFVYGEDLETMRK